MTESTDKPLYFAGPVNGSPESSEGTRVYIRVNDKTVMASKEVARILRNERADAPPVRIEIGENEGFLWWLNPDVLELKDISYFE